MAEKTAERRAMGSSGHIKGFVRAQQGVRHGFVMGSRGIHPPHLPLISICGPAPGTEREFGRRLVGRHAVARTLNVGALSAFWLPAAFGRRGATFWHRGVAHLRAG